MAAQDVHVVKGPNGWDVRQGGGTIATYGTQTQAAEHGRRIARRDKVDLVIFGEDGRIHSKDSYGNESPRRDREH